MRYVEKCSTVGQDTRDIVIGCGKDAICMSAKARIQTNSHNI
jgi:hypothetical protein